MGYSGYGSSGTTPHEHSATAGDGGQLNLNATRITGISPLTMTVAYG